MEVVSTTQQMAERRSGRLKSIFERNRQKLVGFIQKRIRDFEMAEDLAQEVFMKLTNTVDTVESVDAWMYTVASNKIKDYYKKKKEERFDAGEEDLGWNALVADLSSMPDTMMNQEVVWEELHDALALLPELQREAFVKHELEGIPMKEIADIQGSSVATVLSRKRYAVAFIRERLIDFYNELNS